MCDLPDRSVNPDPIFGRAGITSVHYRSFPAVSAPPPIRSRPNPKKRRAKPQGPTPQNRAAGASRRAEASYPPRGPARPPRANFSSRHNPQPPPQGPPHRPRANSSRRPLAPSATCHPPSAPAQPQPANGPPHPQSARGASGRPAFPEPNPGATEKRAAGTTPRQRYPTASATPRAQPPPAEASPYHRGRLGTLGELEADGTNRPL